MPNSTLGVQKASEPQCIAHRGSHAQDILGAHSTQAGASQAPGGSTSDACRQPPLALVRPRAQRRIQRGVALYEVDRTGELQDALIDNSQPVELTNIQSKPQPGFHRIAVNAYFAAYERC